MGTFASMAQNDYGNKLLGGVAFSFALLFSIQFISSFSPLKQVNIINRIELLALAIVAIILGLRVFYIHFPWVEAIYGLAGLTLIVIQIRKIWIQWKSSKNQTMKLTILTVSFRLSILLYLVSMTVVPFVPNLSEPAGETAFVLLLLFLIVAYAGGEIMTMGEKISPVQLINQLKDHSLVMLVLFVLFTAYMGLTKIGAAPAMYSDELPQAYFELVKQETSGVKAENKRKSDEFKKMYEQFIAHQRTSIQK